MEDENAGPCLPSARARRELLSKADSSSSEDEETKEDTSWTQVRRRRRKGRGKDKETAASARTTSSEEVDDPERSEVKQAPPAYTLVEVTSGPVTTTITKSSSDDDGDSRDDIPSLTDDDSEDSMPAYASPLRYHELVLPSPRWDPGWRYDTTTTSSRIHLQNMILGFSSPLSFRPFRFPTWSSGEERATEEPRLATGDIQNTTEVKQASPSEVPAEVTPTSRPVTTTINTSSSGDDSMPGLLGDSDDEVPALEGEDGVEIPRTPRHRVLPSPRWEYFGSPPTLTDSSLLGSSSSSSEEEEEPCCRKLATRCMIAERRD